MCVCVCVCILATVREGGGCKDEGVTLPFGDLRRRGEKEGASKEISNLFIGED